jgi:hypothetical protein
LGAGEYFGICPLPTSGAGLDKAGTGLVAGLGEVGTITVVVVVVWVGAPVLEL